MGLLGSLRSYLQHLVAVPNAMATESSAIARLVEIAQQEDLAPLDGIFEPNDPGQTESVRASPQPAPKTGSSWWLIVVAIVVIGGAVVGGYLLAERQKAENAAKGHVATTPPGEPSVTEPSVTEPEVQPAEPEPTTPLGEHELVLAKQTGFDILVEPKGAKLTLDGHAIGAAPLRVRNLLPGAHRIDIEGPEGYFGQHREFDLAAGEAQVLRISLDMLDPASPLPAQSDKVVEKDIAKTKSVQVGTREKVRKKERKVASSSSASTSVSGSSRSTPSAAEEKALEGANKVSLGTLMLGAKPPCDIIINGKKTGLSTPQRSIQLPEGTHRVVLVNAEHGIRKSFRVRIKSGRTTRAISDLTKKL